ncbi:MAG: thioredoxin family protein [Methanosphaera sp.]|nr:thioredoxin family protein [Methanosphaera sp.]
MSVKLEVFTSQNCPYCPKAMEIAQEAVEELGDQIEYEHLDVNENMDKVREYELLSVPSIVIDGEVAYVGVPEKDELINVLKQKI